MKTSIALNRECDKSNVQEIIVPEPSQSQPPRRVKSTDHPPTSSSMVHGTDQRAGTILLLVGTRVVRKKYKVQVVIRVSLDCFDACLNFIWDTHVYQIYFVMCVTISWCTLNLVSLTEQQEGHSTLYGILMGFI